MRKMLVAIVVALGLVTACGGSGKPAYTLEFPLESAEVYRFNNGEYRLKVLANDSTLKGYAASCAVGSVKVEIEPKRTGTFVRLWDVTSYRESDGIYYQASGAVFIVRDEEQKLLWEEYLRSLSLPHDVLPPATWLQ